MLFDLERFRLGDCINGLVRFGDKFLVESNSRFDLFFTTNDSLVLFNKSNYVGFEILNYKNAVHCEFHVFISGIYLPDFYSDLNLRFNGFYRGFDTDVAEIYIDLISYEEINRDDFYDIFLCLSKYANASLNS